MPGGLAGGAWNLPKEGERSEPYRFLTEPIPEFVSGSYSMSTARFYRGGGDQKDIYKINF